MPHKVPSASALTARQRRAVEGLAAGASLTRAAALAGVDRKTLWRWRREQPSFEAALREARDACFRESLDELRRVSRRAVAALRKALGATGDPALRLSAARAVLANVVRVNETLLIEDRLRELEKVVEGKG